jgi:CheY-like chemotaxis protein
MVKRILIADDDFLSREALVKLAMRQGYEVVAVANGADLLSVSSGHQFDSDHCRQSGVIGIQ